MSGKTKIEWADRVWNPVTGCTPVSAGCEHCYAARMAKRLAGRCGYPADDPFRVTLHKDRVTIPFGWKKPTRIFVNSMGDLFHPDVPDEFIFQVLTVAISSPKHIFMILTKRADRMKDFYERYRDCAWQMLGNVWLGVTAENQATADERIPLLLQTPAAVRFVSVEPMLGPVDLGWIHWEGVTLIDSLTGMNGFPTPHAKGDKKLDWVICGGETGPGARPMHPDWVRSLRDQCQGAGVPFFFKGWGEWLPWDHFQQRVEYKKFGCLNRSGSFFEGTSTWNGRQGDPQDDWEQSVYLVGKKTAGRLLDGREWNEFPEVK